MPTRVPAATRRTVPRRPNSLIASATVLAGGNQALKRVSIGTQKWQERAWRFYDSVGEFRFGAGWIGNGMSRVNMVAATRPQTQGDEPTPVGELPANSSEVADPVDGQPTVPARTRVQSRAMELVDQIGGGVVGQGEIFQTTGTLFTVSGESFTVAEPPLDDPQSTTYFTWSVVSSLDFRSKQGAPTTGNVGPDALYEIRDEEGAWRPVHPNSLIVRSWRGHPARRSEADAPARGAFTVLQQIEMLSARIIADAQSRLAGSGVWLVPSEADFPDPPRAPGDEDGYDDEPEMSDADKLSTALTVAMTVPIADRESASAVVPFILTMPGDLIQYARWQTFSTPFDASLLELLEAAIKRLALALDMPPEVLTGMAGVNHWTAWQVEETAITLHIEPLAETICQAFTEGFLVPALKAEGFTEDDIATVMVWYDTTDLKTRPDKSGNVVQAYDRREASGEALRRELGLNEDDKPNEDEFRQRVLLDVAKGAPTLAPAMLAEAGFLDPDVADAADAADAGGGDAPPPAVEDGNGPPQQEDQAPAAAAAVLASANLIVNRALERANARLKGRVGKGVPGGAATVTCDGPLYAALGDVTQYATIDDLMVGALDDCAMTADILGIQSAPFADVLNRYLRATLAAPMEHSGDRLAAALRLAPASW